MVAATFNEVLNLALVPAAPRPTQAASFGGKTKNGALPRVGRQVRFARSDLFCITVAALWSTS